MQKHHVHFYSSTSLTENGTTYAHTCWILNAVCWNNYGSIYTHRLNGLNSCFSLCSISNSFSNIFFRPLFLFLVLSLDVWHRRYCMSLVRPVRLHFTILFGFRSTALIVNTFFSSLQFIPFSISKGLTRLINNSAVFWLSHPISVGMMCLRQMYFVFCHKCVQWKTINCLCILYFI